MAVYSFHLYDRDCAPVFAHHWRRPAHSLSPSDLDKLVFGVVFSLRNTIRKLSPPAALSNGILRSFPSSKPQDTAMTTDPAASNGGERTGEEPFDDRTLPLSQDSYFTYTTAGYSLHVYEPASSLRLVLVTSPSTNTPASLLNLPSQGAPQGAGTFAPLFNPPPKPGLPQRSAPLQAVTDRVVSAGGSLIPSLSSTSSNTVNGAGIGGDARTLNWQVILQQIYQSLYLDYLVRNPFALPELYTLGGLFDDDPQLVPRPQADDFAVAGAAELEDVALDPPTSASKSASTSVRDTAIDDALRFYNSVSTDPTVTAQFETRRREERAAMKAARKQKDAPSPASVSVSMLEDNGGGVHRYHGDKRLVQNDLFRLALDRFVQSLPAY